MTKINIEEKKRICLSILLNVKDFCDKHNIKYFLFYGTLLGAVRHKGFIPWDDDIDIVMLRKDYDFFIQNFNGLSTDKNYVCLDHSIQDDYYFAYSKIIDKRTYVVENNIPKIKDYGVFIDLFPIDDLPNDIQKSIRVIKKYNIYKRMLRYSLLDNIETHFSKKPPVNKRVYYMISKIIGWKYLLKKIATYHDRYIYKKSNYVCNISLTFYGQKELFTRDLFNKTVLLEFENQLFPVPQNYQKILEQLYGDYMELPPKEKRIAHTNDAYYRNQEKIE